MTLATGSKVTCMAFAPDDGLLVAGSGDHAIRIWTLDLSTSK